MQFIPAFGETLDISNYPTIGNQNAPVQVVAFLEPKCPDSKTYNNNSFPKLNNEYIKTGKVSYSVVTTSFLIQSMPAAVALLCIYKQQPGAPHTDLFFKYLDYIYANQPPERQNWATTDNLLKYATRVSPVIDQKQLKTCIESSHNHEEIEKNTAYGNRLMDHISTPTIFVNGVRVENTDDTIDYTKLKNAIEAASLQNQR